MKFIHFGCWNKGFCNMDNPKNGLSATMKKLNNYIATNKIDFISVAGDNYYPDKKKITEEKKEKIFNLENLMSGLNCLPKGIKKYVTLGNHEIDDIVKLSIDTEELRCKSLMVQQEYATNPANNFMLFDTVNGFTVDNNSTLIIMFDTTLYELFSDKNFNIDETCYRYLFKDVRAKTILNLIEYQEKKILDLVHKYNLVKNLILIAHHPLVYSSNKKGKDRFEYIERLLTFIMENIKIENIYHLCADTHFYQRGIINGRIKQHITGTGGAEQDILPYKSTFEENGVNYIIEENILKFGFLVVNVEGGNVSFEFIESNDLMSGGKRNYYLNKINKYKIKIDLKIF